MHSCLDQENSSCPQLTQRAPKRCKPVSSILASSTFPDHRAADKDDFFATSLFSCSQDFSLWWQTQHIGPTLWHVPFPPLSKPWLTRFQASSGLCPCRLLTQAVTLVSVTASAGNPQDETVKQGKINRSYYHSNLT